MRGDDPHTPGAFHSLALAERRVMRGDHPPHPPVRSTRWRSRNAGPGGGRPALAAAGARERDDQDDAVDHDEEAPPRHRDDAEDAADDHGLAVVVGRRVRVDLLQGLVAHGEREDPADEADDQTEDPEHQDRRGLRVRLRGHPVPALVGGAVRSGLAVGSRLAVGGGLPVRRGLAGLAGLAVAALLAVVAALRLAVPALLAVLTRLRLPVLALAGLLAVAALLAVVAALRLAVPALLAVLTR